MTIAEAKQVRIVDFLARLGHHTQHIKSGQYWYLSPLRNERTPSFKVNDRINEWYDFGEATGGDLVELAKYICRTDCVSEALAYIERLVNGASLPRTRMPTAPPRPVEAEMKDVIVIPLRHHALFSYLQSRLIDADISRMYCKEVHYELRGRHYFALAFGNISGGYEVRNAYYKGCLNNKDISLIRHLTEETQENVCVFEGFMDYLSFLTIRVKNNPQHPRLNAQDYVILNSVSNLSKAESILATYTRIGCFLDNDTAGRNAYANLQRMLGDRLQDMSVHYAGYNDLNEYLCKKLLSQSTEPIKEEKQVQSARRMMQPPKKKGLKI